jgi:hypothetical protein
LKNEPPAEEVKEKVSEEKEVQIEAEEERPLERTEV